MPKKRNLIARLAISVFLVVLAGPGAVSPYKRCAISTEEKEEYYV